MPSTITPEDIQRHREEFELNRFPTESEKGKQHHDDVAWAAIMDKANNNRPTPESSGLTKQLNQLSR
jgi:hypothetical protein